MGGGAGRRDQGYKKPKAGGVFRTSRGGDLPDVAHSFGDFYHQKRHLGTEERGSLGL